MAQEIWFSRASDPERWGEDWPVAYAEAKDPESARRIALMVNMALERAELAEKRLDATLNSNREICKKLNDMAQGMETWPGYVCPPASLLREAATRLGWPVVHKDHPALRFDPSCSACVQEGNDMAQATLNGHR